MIYIFLAYAVGGFSTAQLGAGKNLHGRYGQLLFSALSLLHLALICKMHSNISFYSHIVIFAPFIVDATYTLVHERLYVGERIYQGPSPARLPQGD